MKFYTAYEPGPVEATPAGEKEIPIFELQVNKKGLKELVKTDKVKNIYNIKQEYLEESKVENIIKRYTLGDESVLYKNPGEYLDVTNVPDTLAGWEAQRIEAEQKFAKLPLEIRKEYNYNALEFYDDVLNGKAEERISKVLPDQLKMQIEEKKAKKAAKEKPAETEQQLEYPKYTPGGNIE